MYLNIYMFMCMYANNYVLNSSLYLIIVFVFCFFSFLFFSMQYLWYGYELCMLNIEINLCFVFCSVMFCIIYVPIYTAVSM